MEEGVTNMEKQTQKEKKKQEKRYLNTDCSSYRET